MYPRIWVEEIVFLKLFGTVSKENRSLLVTIATIAKENFPQFISKHFLSWCYFCKQKLSHRLGTWDIFSRTFSIVCIFMATTPKIWTYTNIFLWFCKFQFYIYILTNIQTCVVYLPKIYCFKEKGVIKKSSYVIHRKLS